MTGADADAAPPGYVHAAVGRADMVCAEEAVRALADAVAGAGTLYGYAERHPERRAFQGRAPAYAVPLPWGAGDVVVRHAWHGGLLRKLTRDLYLPPTRAPGELRTSEWLRAAGVRTPRVVAYVRYPAPLGLRRADVATRLVPDGRDLAAVLFPGADDRQAAALRPGWLEATAELLAALARAHARHPDLNLKNVLLAPDDAGATRAWALDVDVVTFVKPPDENEQWAEVAWANFRRLGRSLAKWGRARGVPVTEFRVGDADLGALLNRTNDILYPGGYRTHRFSFGAPA